MRRSLEIPAIPDNWRIPPRGQYTLSAADPNRGFMAVRFPSNPAVSGKNYRGEYAEYFFNPIGNLADYRTHSLWDTSIKVDGTYFRLHQWPGKPLEKSTLDIRFAQDTPSDSSPANSLASVSYEDGRLRSILFGGVFSRKDTEAKAPVVSLRRDGNSEQFSIHLLSGESFNMQMISPNEICIRDDTKERYRIVWKLKKGQLIAEQEDIANHVTRVITVTVEPDMKKVVECAYSELTIQDQLIKRRGYEPPWKSIGQVVGVSLKYSPQGKTK